VVVFVRTEVWPVLAREASARGARVLLVNAVLSEGSGRLSRAGRWFMRSIYRRLHVVGAVDRPHADRYQRLGVPAERIRVTGDARFDQVWARIEERGLVRLRGAAEAWDMVDAADAMEAAGPAERVPAELRPLWRALHDPEVFTLVAGSTWPADEAVLLPPLTVLRRDRPIRVVIAPHEPTTTHLEALELRLDRLALRHARLGALAAAGVGSGAPRAEPPAGGAPRPVVTAPEVVIVDRMGVLADLYGLADAAYVGGGFGRAGLHSVVEPAALGVPVLFGPSHGNAREAGELAAAGGGFIIASQAELEERLRLLVDNRALAASSGEKAREYVRSETGSAVRNATLILDALDT
jgi:3-deoxy-D-manno-octulosonic-acid transferase